MTLDVALRHRFGGEAGFALDAAFAAPTPGVTVLFGPSGCGKSTTLAAVAGLLRPREGRVALDGDVLLDTARGIVQPPERRRLGVVFQDARLFPHLSVRSNLRYGARRAPRGATGPSEEEVVALLGIAPLLSRRPRDLSGGERQRVALGRALLARPRMLLMDEPLAALDAARRAEVLPFLARLRDGLDGARPREDAAGAPPRDDVSGARPRDDVSSARPRDARIPILYVTHALDEVDTLADTLVLMEGGRVLAAGPVEALSARTDLPLAARRDAGVLLRCTVEAHDAGAGLTRIAFAGGAFRVPLRGDAPGTAIRLRVRARDVAVATEAPRGLSVQNVLPATLAGIGPVPGSPHEAYLRLALGPGGGAGGGVGGGAPGPATAILARVTRDAIARLSLREGMPLHALVKSVAFQPAAMAAGP